MSFSLSSSQRTDLNVTPLIDVLLVLLIIFMVITPTAPHGLSSQLPQGQAKPNDSASPEPVVVEVSGTDAAPVFRLNRQSVDATALPGQLAVTFQNRPERVVFIRASRDLTFQPVAAVVATARGAGATTIALDDPAKPIT